MNLLIVANTWGFAAIPPVSCDTVLEVHGGEEADVFPAASVPGRDDLEEAGGEAGTILALGECGLGGLAEGLVEAEGVGEERVDGGNVSGRERHWLRRRKLGPIGGFGSGEGRRGEGKKNENGTEIKRGSR